VNLNEEANRYLNHCLHEESKGRSDEAGEILVRSIKDAG